ncbi:MAG: MauE/DoxX family redox-associated membrane protein [Bacteroidota bacterium]
MKSLLENDYVVFAARVLLGMVFLVASIDKVADPAAFAVSIQNYKIISQPFTMLVATILPWVELLCALGLLFGFRIKASAFLCFIMLLVFTLGVVSGLIRGLDISCGCFTQDPSVGRIGWTKVFENVGMLLVALMLLFSRGKKFAIEKDIQ